MKTKTSLKRFYLISFISFLIMVLIIVLTINITHEIRLKNRSLEAKKVLEEELSEYELVNYEFYTKGYEGLINIENDYYYKIDDKRIDIYNNMELIDSINIDGSLNQIEEYQRIFLFDDDSITFLDNDLNYSNVCIYNIRNKKMNKIEISMDYIGYLYSNYGKYYIITPEEDKTDIKEIVIDNGTIIKKYLGIYNIDGRNGFKNIYIDSNDYLIENVSKEIISNMYDIDVYGNCYTYYNKIFKSTFEGKKYYGWPILALYNPMDSSSRIISISLSYHSDMFPYFICYKNKIYIVINEDGIKYDRTVILCYDILKKKITNSDFYYDKLKNAYLKSNRIYLEFNSGTKYFFA